MGWNADEENATTVANDCACGERPRTVSCETCRARYCIVERHQRELVSVATSEMNASEPVGKLLLDVSPFSVGSSLQPASSRFLSGLDSDARDDPDQELSPTPPTKSASSSSTASSSSYDLWGPWSVRTYGRPRVESDQPSAHRSPTMTGRDEWQGFQSISTDEGRTPALSPAFSLGEDENFPLSSLNKSFRSKSFASNSDEAEAATPGKRTLRPRSFSDYTSLGSNKLDDIWNERLPHLPSTLPTMKPSPDIEIYRAMKTTVASRHVIIKTNDLDELDTFARRVVLDTLNGYGPVASYRDDFAADGVLFCTFYELKAAIGAVKMWFTNNTAHATATETTAYFSIPYEPLSEINCATVLVQLLHGGGLVASFSDMRQLCARYGEVASVLDKDAVDGSASQYIIEFNDVRDVPTAMTQLTGAILPSGHIVSISRSHPPTFDPVKVHFFQDHAKEGEPTKHPRYMGNRPKSYSESTTMLVSPSSMPSASPLAMSFLELPESRHNDDASLAARSSIAPEDRSPVTCRGSPPFGHRLPPTSDIRRVRESARPRSSSAYASLSTAAVAPDGFGVSPSAHSPPFSGNGHRAAPQHPFVATNQRMGPIRTASDPGFRHSYASSHCGSTGSVGRNDQGTGEFSLSIEKVASGEDTRTTLMVRNIPNKYTQQMLLAEINVHHHGKYDFFYLPIDFKNKCNMGYAFINFIEAASIVPFYQEFDSQKWTNFNSEKVCAISYARLQGKQAMITRFQNSSLLDKHESYRPLVFHSSGPNRGKPETFPAPKQPMTHHHHHHHHHPGTNPFLTKNKLPHQHGGASPHLMMNASDEYLLGRLYAQQQHAMMANAHAAAAAMLHSMPALGLPTNSMGTPYTQQRSFEYRGGYPPHGGADRRHGHAYLHSNSSAASSTNVFPGSGFSST